MNYSKIKYLCTTNGAGFTTSIYVSGCDMMPHCKGCFNQVAWDYNNGDELTDDIIDKMLESIEPVYVDGLSILGGEPLSKKNLEGVNHIIDKFKTKFGNEKKIWLWTGYYKDKFSDEQLSTAIRCDYVVDGPFVQDLFSTELRYKGSSNQTVWEIKDGIFNVSEYD